MIVDIDVWRSAHLLMKQRDEPEFYAAQRADELLAAGDVEGQRVWRRIGMATGNLSERKPICPTCRDARWVCENHPDRPWRGESDHEGAVIKKPPAKSATRLHVSACQRCGGTGWVCEDHRDRPWASVSDRADACGCGAGMPCSLCNTSDPPEMRWVSPRRRA